MDKEQNGGDVSSEVIGILSQAQQQECNFLGVQLITSQGLDPKNPDDVEVAKRVLEDCVFKGLDILGKRWFRPQESVAPVFTEGLKYREDIVNKAKAIIDGRLYESCFSIDEANRLFTLNFSPLSPIFSEIESMVGLYNRKRVEITKFQNEIFENSSLAAQSKFLREEAVITQWEDSRWDISDRLFANFLANLALYKKPGLELEPKDIAALIELWQDPEVRKRSQEVAIEQVKILARNLKLSDNTIEIYTRSIFEKVNYQTQDSIDLETLSSVSIFIISQEAIIAERKEFKNDEGKVISIPQEQLEKATVAYGKFNRLLTEANQRSLEETGEGILEELWESYYKYIKSLTPLELLFLFKGVLEKGTVREEAELNEFVPYEVYRGALPFIYASSLTLENGSPVLDLEDIKIKSYLKLKIPEFVFNKLFEGGLSWNEELPQLPPEALAQFFGVADYRKLSEEQKNAIISLSDETWINLCLNRGIEYSITKSKSSQPDSVLESLMFPTDAINLIPYFETLPPDKIDRISRSLQKVITF